MAMHRNYEKKKNGVPKSLDDVPYGIHRKNLWISFAYILWPTQQPSEDPQAFITESDERCRDSAAHTLVSLISNWVWKNEYKEEAEKKPNEPTWNW